MILRAAVPENNVTRIDDKKQLDEIFKRQFHRWGPALKYLRSNNLVAFEKTMPKQEDGAT